MVLILCIVENVTESIFSGFDAYHQEGINKILKRNKFLNFKQSNYTVLITYSKYVLFKYYLYLEVL